MKCVLAVTFLSSIADDVGASRVAVSSFQSYMKTHGRSYAVDSDEYHMRRALFEQRARLVHEHNSVVNRSWKATINKLSDRTDSELMALRGWDGSGRPTGGRSARPHRAFLQVEDDSELPNEKLWTGLNSLQKIRNQADCGSCWAISSATVLEAHAEISGRPRTISAQQIVECTPNPKKCGGDGGCQGATAELAMDWVLKFGVAEESAIPYTGQDAPCPSVDAKVAMAQMMGVPNSNAGNAMGMVGWETLPNNDYMPLMRALAQQGPVAVSVAADAWNSYDSGIFNGCGKDAVIDHAVTAVGYGQEDGKPFWTIQNSWGSDWGETGRIRLERHTDGKYCGMNNDPEKGIACKGDTTPVPVCGMCGVLFDSVVPHFQSQ